MPVHWTNNITRRSNMPKGHQGFPKKGENPEFDKIREEASKKGSKNSPASVPGYVQDRTKFKRAVFWNDQVSKYLATEGKENAGYMMLLEIDNLMANATSDNAKKELLKIKAGILGFNAPAVQIEEPIAEEEEETMQEKLSKLAELGIDVGDIDVIEDGKVVSTENEDDTL